ncbi:MAG: GLUG motif-containing protein [Dehalococcoidia bacterium]
MARLAILLSILALIIGAASCAPVPIEIRDWYDLHAMRNNLKESYVLMNQLDSTTPGYVELASATANGGRGWEPIGTSDEQFTGRFNGQGYEIRDLFINRPDQDYVGLFTHISWTRYIDNVGVVENVGLVNARVTGRAQVGSLVGHNEGLVKNCYSSGIVTGDERVGGLVGWNQATLTASYSTCSVIGNSRVGGLVGDNWYHDGILNNSYATGDVTGNEDVGGLAGVNYYGTIDKSYSTGSATGTNRVGGLVGWNKGTVTDSFWDIITSRVGVSDGGTGKTTTEMMDIATFAVAAWNITAVAASITDVTCIWNIVDKQTYPFLSWQSVS